MLVPSFEDDEEEFDTRVSSFVVVVKLFPLNKM